MINEWLSGGDIGAQGESNAMCGRERGALHCSHDIIGSKYWSRELTLQCKPKHTQKPSNQSEINLVLNVNLHNSRQLRDKTTEPYEIIQLTLFAGWQIL